MYFILWNAVEWQLYLARFTAVSNDIANRAMLDIAIPGEYKVVICEFSWYSRIIRI
jgi:hypothetical protein